MSDPFGVSRGGGSYHTGIDLDMYGFAFSPIFSVCDGVVISTEYLTYSYGYHVIVDCGDGWTTLYAHMSQINVSPGQRVSAGSTLGMTGLTGLKLGSIDAESMAIRGRLKNAGGHQAPFGAKRATVSSCYIKEALEQGAQKFGWQERLARNGKKNGSKVTAVAVGQAFHPAGFNGFDGLLRILPTEKRWCCHGAMLTTAWHTPEAHWSGCWFTVK